jgi:hypothetical protein
MMRRLRDQVDAADPIVARAAKMLGAAEPFVASDATRRRILASVVRETPPRRQGWKWIASPAIIGAVLLGTTIAGATLERAWITQTYRSLVALASITGTRPASEPETQPALSRKAPGGPESPAAGTPVESLPRAPQAFSATPGAPVASSSGDGATLVLSAIGVLRREHDPARAGRMLSEYLRKHPRGALREEAMALSIEAAMARDDARASQQLAARYERAYPKGRFLSISRAALGQPSP